MKYLIISLLLVCNAYAYDGVIKDKKGNVLSYVKVDKETEAIQLYDKTGKKTHTIDANGTIKDSKGNIKGKVKR